MKSLEYGTGAPRAQDHAPERASHLISMITDAARRMGATADPEQRHAIAQETFARTIALLRKWGLRHAAHD